MKKWKDHPSTIERDGEVKLKIFCYFVEDRTLPKFLNENGEVVLKNKTMKIEDYLNSPDKRSLYRRSYYENSTDALFDVQMYPNRKVGLWRKIKEMLSSLFSTDSGKKDITETFKETKSSLKTIPSETSLKEANEKIDRAKERLVKAGQYDVAMMLSNQKSITAKEIVLLKNNISLYLTEEDVVSILKKADFGIRLDFLEDYPEILPEDVSLLKIKADELKIFDNWCILHYDPKGEALKQIEKIEKRRDPILFGMIAGSGKLYKVADWVFKEDDITVEKICKILNVNNLKSTSSNKLVEYLSIEDGMAMNDPSC